MSKLLPFAVVGLLFAPLTVAHAQESTSAQLGQDDLLSLSQRYAEAWSILNPDRVAALFASDGRFAINGSEPAEGRDAIAEIARGFIEAVPDMVVAFDRLEWSRGHVLFHWRLTGTNIGPGGTGVAVRIRDVEAWIVGPGGLIVDSAGSFDGEVNTFTLARALGEPK
ncbi:nuclear transport factor 2 family protein [Erythrobacter sp.]|uniref:nuclear transport factor 2 family protein n=1 Tax=Erythrobacter sp. TaxID=1042 RepID=UPI003C77877A